MNEAISPDSAVDDDEIVTWWGLVIEGYHLTAAKLASAIMDGYGLPMASLDILLRLVRSPDNRMPMTKLAREAALSSGGFTKVADRLAKAGLIRRVPSETDRRVTFAELTDHGLDVADRARATSAQVLREHVLAPLGGKDSRALAEAMRTLREANSPED
ncbi:MarR family winged helix-turn-helix transcriptional regulator [Saccharopolyspora dendranthemae]|uniref:DNA-binding MarR family transcriptional regulator n=1 Tax=Saccharopolyspora dendranthemae TaxID=1181886 RepID=A0A561V727_9PSEU|nr:MarR family transcriptional regulator [Saccharopolyspora dendranthemae]TWG07419.1 DNA-binding MarR family transcriptional regulator [Saccharopolyspora dendranthemae]